jgi:hypothetical protein
MKMRIVFLICFSLAAVILTSAQGRTITDADLEKYAHERIKAEQNLRENYTKLGFASPEERARRNAADAREREELSARLRQERLLRERAAAEVEQLRVQQTRYDAYVRSLTYVQPAEDYYPGYLGYGYGFGRTGRFPKTNGRVWRADASGVVYEPGGRPSSIYTPILIRPAARPVFLPMRRR